MKRRLIEDFVVMWTIANAYHIIVLKIRKFFAERARRIHGDGYAALPFEERTF